MGYRGLGKNPEFTGSATILRGRASLRGPRSRAREDDPEQQQQREEPGTAERHRQAEHHQQRAADAP
jgi:hypothetical protein